MKFNNKHEKNEAEDLAWSLCHDRPSCFGENIAIIFEKIIKEIEDIDWQRHHRDFDLEDIPYEKPFLKGEQISQGLPDIIYDSEDYVVGIEHFEFDASGKSRKGSKMRLAELTTEKELKLKRQKATKYPIYTEASVNVDFTYEGYVQSLLSAFAMHYSKIENYKEKIKEYFPKKKIYFGFFIEDITAIGNYIITGNKTEPIYPLLAREFVTVLEKCSGIDFVISKIQDTYVPYIYIHQIDNETIKKLNQDSYDMTHSKYYAYHYKKVSHTYGLDD